jgi:hypothetical protein
MAIRLRDTAMQLFLSPTGRRCALRYSAPKMTAESTTSPLVTARASTLISCQACRVTYRPRLAGFLSIRKILPCMPVATTAIFTALDMTFGRVNCRKCKRPNHKQVHIAWLPDLLGKVIDARAFELRHVHPQ